MYVNGAIVVEVINKRKLIGLLDFNYTVIGGNVDRLSCQVCSLQRPENQMLENVNDIVRKEDSRWINNLSQKSVAFLGVLWGTENEITAKKDWVRTIGRASPCIDFESGTIHVMELILLLNRARSLKVASNASFSRLELLLVMNNRKSLSVWSMWRTWQKTGPAQHEWYCGRMAFLQLFLLPRKIASTHWTCTVSTKLDENYIP